MSYCLSSFWLCAKVKNVKMISLPLICSFVQHTGSPHSLQVEHHFCSSVTLNLAFTQYSVFCLSNDLLWTAWTFPNVRRNVWGKTQTVLAVSTWRSEVIMDYIMIVHINGSYYVPAAVGFLKQSFIYEFLWKVHVCFIPVTLTGYVDIIC